MVMLVPLMILALLSIVGGLVGIGNRFEHFLAPVFRYGRTAAGSRGRGRKQRTEYLLMGVSVTVALPRTDSGLACSMSASRNCRSGLPTRLGGFYEAVVNKYYIDELYAKLFVKPLIDGSTEHSLAGRRPEVIDATVNNAADGARHVSDEVRHMQSGNLRSYAGWVAAGRRGRDRLHGLDGGGR